MTPKEKSTPIDAVDKLIVFHSGIHAAFMLTEKNHRCAIDDALDYIAALEASSTHSTKADVEALERVKTEIRLRIGDCEEDNKAWRNEPRNSPTVQRGIQANANRILAYNNAIRLLDKEIAATTINSKESRE